MSGVDVIAITGITSTNVTGDALLTFVVNPLSLTDSRLGQYSQLWARWRPLSLMVEASPSAGGMMPGGYIVGWSADPSDQFRGQAQASIVHLTALGCQMQRPIGQGGRLKLPVEATSRWYVTRGSPVEDSHGVVMAALTGPIGANKTSIVWKMHWTIEFDGPDMPLPGEVLFIEPQSDFAGIFTDSVSDWNGGKSLTFKHSEGGQVVPWQGVQSGIVYTVTSGVTIPYVYIDNSTGKAVTKTSYCKWFSRIINSSAYGAALACHASKEDARAYQNNADDTKVLTYVAAGGWATPQLPRLKGEVVSLSMVAPPLTPSLDNPIRDLQEQVARLTSQMAQLLNGPTVVPILGAIPTPRASTAASSVFDDLEDVAA